MAFLYRKPVELTQGQLQMVKSGWGQAVIENSSVEECFYLSDGLKVKAFVATPKNMPVPSGGYPCLLWNRGGYAKEGEIDNFTARGLFGQIASWGYAVFASQYRGSSQSEGRDEFGGRDVDDIFNLMELAGDVEPANPSLWAIEGWSRGGMMTYLVLLRSSIFRAAIISGGIADVRCSEKESPFMSQLYHLALGEPGSKEFTDACRSRSVIERASELPLSTPLLLLHGTADDRVPPSDSIELSQKLLGLGHTFRLVLYEGGDHFLKSHRREADQLRRQWLDRFVKTA